MIHKKHKTLVLFSLIALIVLGGRAWIVRLTPKGRRTFEAMAREHEQWLLARGSESQCGLRTRRIRSRRHGLSWRFRTGG